MVTTAEAFIAVGLAVLGQFAAWCLLIEIRRRIRANEKEKQTDGYLDPAAPRLVAHHGHRYAASGVGDQGRPDGRAVSARVERRRREANETTPERWIIAARQRLETARAGGNPAAIRAAEDALDEVIGAVRQIRPVSVNGRGDVA